jgi:hypothetical protein
VPLGYTYTTYQQAVCTQIPTVLTDPNFVVECPQSIDYAELTILRDLDLLAAHGNVMVGPTVIGANTLAVPPGVIVLEELYLGPNNTPIAPMSQTALRTIYGGAPNGPPQYFTIVGASPTVGPPPTWSPSMSILLGPTPDQIYALTAYGTERPAPLSATNTTTFISLQLSDLFWAAAMIYWSGVSKNFGAQSDDPRQAMSWSGEYSRLLKGAQMEEARKKFQSSQWQAEAPAPLAGTPR